MFPQIQTHCDSLAASFSAIPDERKTVLSKIAAYIQSKKDSQLPVQLVYICTHNSRRSHFGQVWAAVAASYYNVPEIQTFAGGMEATAFHPNAIRALENTGFDIQSNGSPNNPVYTVRFGDNETCSCFSKVYDDPAN